MVQFAASISEVECRLLMLYWLLGDSRKFLILGIENSCDRHEIGRRRGRKYDGGDPTQVAK